MIIISDIVSIGAGDIRFNVQQVANGQLSLEVTGCRVVGGKLYGPAKQIGKGHWLTLVKFGGDLYNEIVRALKPILDRHPDIKQPQEKL